MDALASAQSGALQGRQNVATAVTQQAIKSEQQSAQAIASMIDQSASNLQSITSGSSTGPGVGGRVDRQV